MVIEKVINKLKESYQLKEIDIGEYASIKKFPMKFKIKSFKVGEVGYVSILNMSAMFGMMKMETVVFSPLTVDAPLFSFDLIEAMGNDTIIVDIYDLAVNKGKPYPSLVALKEKYKELPQYDLKPCWYDSLRVDGVLAKKGKKIRPQLENATDDYIDEFMNILKTAELCEVAPKRAVIKEYVDGLFDNGAPTTEQFNKILGEEKARDMYGKYIFFSTPLE